MATPTSVTPAKGQRKRPADFTGLKTERLNEEKKAEQLESASRMAMVNAEREEASNEVIDYFPEAGEELPSVEVRAVEANKTYRIIRVNTDIDKMVYGRDVIDPGDVETGRMPTMGTIKFWDFKEGQPYRVSKDMAEHLNNLGYLSYMGA
jgi:hypothetical protein